MDREELARSVLDQLGETHARLVHVRDGREHHVFRAQFAEGERMLKIPREDGLADPFDPTRTPLERLMGEGDAISLARGVPVPRFYAVHNTTPVSATMEVLPGQTAEQALERGQLDESSLARVCLQMGRTLAALHGVRRPEGNLHLPVLPGETDGPARLLHLDFHLGNVIGRPHLGMGWEITGVVDWTCARWGPAEADFVEMQIGVFIRNPGARDAFIAGYRQISLRAVDVADVERRAGLELKRRLASEPDAGGEARHHWQAFADRF